MFFVLDLINFSKIKFLFYYLTKTNFYLEKLQSNPMSFIQYHKQIVDGLPHLHFQANFSSVNETYNYEAFELKKLRRAINNIETISFIKNEIAEIKKSWLFSNSDDQAKINFSQHSAVDNPLKQIIFRLNFIKELAESSKLFGSEDVILIKIPEISSFDNLSKYANDFKKAIEIPIIDSNTSGEVKILSAEEGSIILFVSVGTLGAITLVGKICWSAAVIKKKRSEAKIFELHAKTLELKNDALENLIDAQKQQLKNILNAEAQQIANSTYDLKDPETLERLKLSINTISDLIDKGVQILPVSNNDEIQNIFPNYKNLDLIESSIKQIASNN